MPKERYFLSGDRLKVVSFHVLLLDTAGNNLVNADFSPYLRHIFTVKYIYLTLYIVHICRVAPIYSVPLYLLALLAVRACWRSLWPSYLRPDRFQPIAVCVAVWPCSLRCSLARLCARCARLPAPVCASADAWSTVDFFVRRPRVACLACPLSVCVWARACARVRGRCPPTFQSLAVHFIRL